MKRWCRMPSPLGELLLTSEAGALTAIAMATPDRVPQPPQDASEDRAAFEDAVRQLEEYFSGTRREFSLPLAPKGTEFQQRVWRALQRIPFGETRAYVDIARELGNPGAVRAVGLANGRNPIAIVIPCHRVIGKDGSLTGYAGGLENKRKLLALEGIALGESLAMFD